MKKLLIISAAILLVLACGKKDNPLEIDKILVGGGDADLCTVAGVSPGNRTQLVDENPSTTPIEATVQVVFSNFMDPASLTSTSVKVKSTTSGSEITTVLNYNKDARVLFIRSDNWPTSQAFLLTIVSGASGAKNVFGTAIDGDADNFDDGTPYDDYLSTFFTAGSAADSCVGVIADQARIASITPARAMNTNLRPAVAVTFNRAMDTLTFTGSTIQLAAEGGAPVSVTWAPKTPTVASFTPSADLSYGTKYIIKVVSKDTKSIQLANTPAYLVPLDGNRNGPQQTEPDTITYFVCDTAAAPTVTAARITGGVSFTFSRIMDTTTTSTVNVKVFDRDGYVPGSFVFSTPGGNTTRIEYYFQRTVTLPLDAFVSKEAKATNGKKLDGETTPNGIGGEPWDDYWRRNVP